jgi:hypothetical protein
MAASFVSKSKFTQQPNTPLLGVILPPVRGTAHDVLDTGGHSRMVPRPTRGESHQKRVQFCVRQWPACSDGGRDV